MQLSGQRLAAITKNEQKDMEEVRGAGGVGRKEIGEGEGGDYGLCDEDYSDIFAAGKGSEGILHLTRHRLCPQSIHSQSACVIQGPETMAELCEIFPRLMILYRNLVAAKKLVLV
jgi:hypothetical protein